MWRVVNSRRIQSIRLGSERGFTLAEALIAAVVGIIVLLGLYLSYDVNRATFVRGEQQTDLQQNGRIAVDRIVREFRLAGYDPSGVLTGGPTIPGGQDNCANLPATTPQAIENAEATCIRFYADVDPTGPFGTERVEYSYDGANQVLRRRQWYVTGASNGAQPLAERVTAVNFAYYDSGGNLLPTPVPEMNLGSIRRISVTITTADTQTGSGARNFTLRAEVRPRNHGL